MAESRKYFALPPHRGYTEMFDLRGWQLVDNVSESDLVLFTGGADVHPSYYGHGEHSKTSFNKERDKKEALFFDNAMCQGKPMVGICRGGQFLNVMSGGSLYQHVDGHAVGGTHVALDKTTGEEFQVTSTHHQMMKPDRTGMVLVTARESSFKEECVIEGTTNKHLSDIVEDVEVVYYEHTNCLCFQPHPEFPGHEELADRFFVYVEDFLYN